MRHGAEKAIVAGAWGTPLHQAAAHGHVSTVKAMLKAGCPVDAVTVNGLSVLHSAAAGGNAEVIREVLSTGCDINAADNDGETPLHVAAREGKTEALKELIRCGASKEGTALGFAPLHFAVLSENKDCVRVLLELGADPRKVAPYIGSAYVFAIVGVPTVVEAFDDFLVEEDERLPQLQEILRGHEWFQELQLDRRSSLTRDTFGISRLEYMLVVGAYVSDTLEGDEVVLHFHNLSFTNTNNLLLLAAILGLNTLVNNLTNIATFHPYFAAQTVTSLIKLRYRSESMSHLQELVSPDASLNLLHVAVLAMKGRSVEAIMEAGIDDHPSLLKSLVTSDSFHHTLHEYLPNGLTPLDLAEKLGLDEAVTIISSAGGRHGIWAMLSEEVRLQHGPALLLAHQELMKVASSGALGQQAVQAVISQLPGRSTVEKGTATEESHIRQKVLDQRPDLAVIIRTVLSKINFGYWEETGILLQVPTSTLEYLERNQSQLRDKYRNVLKYWLDHSEAASWRTLLEVLGHLETKQTMDHLTQDILATQDSAVS